MNKKMKDFVNNEIIVNSKINREDGYLYYIDKDGDISRIKMSQKGKPEKVMTLNIRKEMDYLYYIDKDGHICRCLTSQGLAKRKRAMKAKK
jgi:hypothetical protein